MGCDKAGDGSHHLRERERERKRERRPRTTGSRVVGSAGLNLAAEVGEVQGFRLM